MRSFLLAAILVLINTIPSFGDYVIAFHIPGCKPCRAVTPLEEKLRSEGYDIRTVNADIRKDLTAFYGVTRFPSYAYVYEFYGQSYDTGTRLVYPITEGQLRRFCIMPGVVTVGAETRSLIRGILGTPILLDW